MYTLITCHGLHVKHGDCRGYEKGARTGGGAHGDLGGDGSAEARGHLGPEGGDHVLTRSHGPDSGLPKHVHQECCCDSHQRHGSHDEPAPNQTPVQI